MSGGIVLTEEERARLLAQVSGRAPRTPVYREPVQPTVAELLRAADQQIDVELAAWHRAPAPTFELWRALTAAADARKRLSNAARTQGAPHGAKAT